MSALRTALSSALTPALGSARRGVSRYFTTFDEVAQTYIQTSSTASLISDFSIQVDILVADVSTISTAAMILGNTVGTSNSMWVTNSGAVNIRDSSGVTRSSSAVILDNTLQRLKLERVSGNISLFVDGTAAISDAPFGSFIFDLVGVRQTSSFNFDGIISNLIVKDGVSTVLSYPINRYYTPTSNVVIDESGNGNNGTFVNIAAGRSKYYQQRADGSFVDLQGNVLEVAY